MGKKGTPQPKTRSERLQVVNETKMQCIAHNLESELGTRILFRALDKYHQDGTTYINKQIRLTLRGDMGRYYLVNLYNQKYKRDVVLIRAMSPDEADEARPTQTSSPDEARPTQTSSPDEAHAIQTSSPDEAHATQPDTPEYS